MYPRNVPHRQESCQICAELLRGSQLPVAPRAEVCSRPSLLLLFVGGDTPSDFCLVRPFRVFFPSDILCVCCVWRQDSKLAIESSVSEPAAGRSGAFCQKRGFSRRIAAGSAPTEHVYLARDLDMPPPLRTRLPRNVQDAVSYVADTLLGATLFSRTNVRRNRRERVMNLKGSDASNVEELTLIASLSPLKCIPPSWGGS